MSNVNENTSIGSGWTLSSPGSFEPLDEKGHKAVVLNVGEPYEKPDRFSDDPDATKEFFNVTYGSQEQLMENGDPMVITKPYTKSLHPKSNFYRDLVAILGRPLSPEETKNGFKLVDRFSVDGTLYFERHDDHRTGFRSSGVAHFG